MVTDPRFPHIPALDENQTQGEDVALALAFVIVLVLGLTLMALLMLEFFDLLPGGLGTVAFFSLGIFSVMVGRAILSRALSTPTLYTRPSSNLRVHY